MNLDGIAKLKDRIAKIAAFLCLLCVICVLDGAVAYFREPFNTLKLLPGDTVKLTGPMAPGATSVEGMAIETSSDSVSATLEEVISGFWMGGKMWRGTLKLSPQIAPGNYLFSVFGKEDQKRVGSNVFQVIVYLDQNSRLADSRSLILRNSGVSPWVMACIFLGFVVVCCLALFFISGERDRLMAERGEAEVFHITKDENGLSIYFGLGSKNGVEKGTALLLMDPERELVGEITVESVSDGDGVAKVGLQSPVIPGYIVKKI